LDRVSLPHYPSPSVLYTLSLHDALPISIVTLAHLLRLKCKPGLLRPEVGLLQRAYPRIQESWELHERDDPGVGRNEHVPYNKRSNVRRLRSDADGGARTGRRYRGSRLREWAAQQFGVSSGVSAREAGRTIREVRPGSRPLWPVWVHM